MSDLNFQKLNVVAEFWGFESRFCKIHGWVFGPEGYALMLFAAHGPGAGEIVEIGSWMGRSTCWLAAGSKSRGREKVYAVDTFRGGPQQGGHELLREEGTTYFAFVDNLEANDLLDSVEPIVAASAEAVMNWNKPIRLLFIDAEHTREAIKHDFEAWSRFLIVGGIVGFDDISSQYPDVARWYEEMLSANPNYRQVLQVGKMRFVQRLT